MTDMVCSVENTCNWVDLWFTSGKLHWEKPLGTDLCILCYMQTSILFSDDNMLKFPDA